MGLREHPDQDAMGDPGQFPIPGCTAFGCGAMGFSNIRSRGVSLIVLTALHQHLPSDLNMPSQHLHTPEPGDLLFAYGTLKHGGQYHQLLEKIGAEYVGRGQLVIPYPLLLAEYPCLLDQPGAGQCVKGEVFRIQRPQDWGKLDWLEGHPEEYKRRVEPVRVEGHRMMAWTYFYLLPHKLDPGLLPVEEFPVG